MPGTEISPGQLKSKWELVVKLQRYFGNEAQSRFRTWKATRNQSAHVLCHPCVFVQCPNRRFALFNHLARGPIYQPQLHRDAPSPSSLSAWLSVNGLACQILLIHSRRRDYTGMAPVHLRNGAGPSQTTAISWDTLNENWLKEPCQVWGTGATKTKLFFWATRFWAIYYGRRTTSTK